MTINALSGHGTLLAYETATEEGGGAPTPGTGRFTTVAELNDITPPEFMYNEFDSTVQNENIDSYVMGVMRRGPFQGKINFIPTEATHNETTGLMYLFLNKTRIGWRYKLPGSWTLIASGQCRQLAIHDPVDGIQSADITVRMSGKFLINGTVYGS